MKLFILSFALLFAFNCAKDAQEPDAPVAPEEVGVPDAPANQLPPPVEPVITEPVPEAPPAETKPSKKSKVKKKAESKKKKKAAKKPAAAQ